jgi:hypothetical protein
MNFDGELEITDISRQQTFDDNFTGGLNIL